MPSKQPWDHLRGPVKPPIGAGEWRSANGAIVRLDSMTSYNVQLGISPQGDSWCFAAGDLRQLAEFCTELADQLEGK